ncbi:hypothetical protein [Embleya sp. NPDC059237]|uniref:hypothetical protein n=1 Tax=Embleya sp. NPDC059237 TaxID=3346784 RepID=UPI0036BB8903
MSYTVQYTDRVRIEIQGMAPKTRAAFEAGMSVVASDPYGADSKPYPRGNSRDHRITHVAGVAIITYQVTPAALLVTVVQLVAR